MPIDVIMVWSDSNMYTCMEDIYKSMYVCMYMYFLAFFLVFVYLRMHT